MRRPDMTAIATSNAVPHRPKVVDLFAGAGGFSLGALDAGAEVVAAVELNSKAALSYRKNLIESGITNAKLFGEDILELSPALFMEQAGLRPGECDLLLGGPPCQGFSTHRLNGAGIDDPRNKLLLRYFEYVKALRPRYFLVENVPGLLWPRHKDYVDSFYEAAKASGYVTLAPTLLNAQDYGVPQSRKRVFILGFDPSKAQAPNWPPLPTHVNPVEKDADGRPGWCPASDVFASPTSKDDPNDIHMNHGVELTEAFKLTPINGGSRMESGRQLPCHENHRGHFDVYGRIDPSRPGPTMTTACINPSKGRFVHPTANHGITLREAARLQTFPDWFQFEGGLMAGGVQVGNAVPVKMAFELIKFILRSNS
jgi:DNA (cytosine-5)-methyltransferase 1